MANSLITKYQAQAIIKEKQYYVIWGHYECFENDV